MLILAALFVAASRRDAGAHDDDLSSIVRDANAALSQIPPDFSATRVSGYERSSSTMSGPIHIGYRRGHCVAVHPASGAKASVRLRDVAKHMGRRGELPATVAGDDEFLSYLDLYDDGPNASLMVSGKVARKLKGAVKKVAKVAKKVVNNKVVKAIGGMVAKVLPPPISTGFAAVQMGVQVARKIAGAKPGTKAAKAGPIVSALATGKITRPQAEQRARTIGVNPVAVVATGVALKLRADANAGNPQARALFAVHDRVQAAGSSPQAAQAAVRMVQTARPA
jgi:hypothetical protein